MIGARRLRTLAAPVAVAAIFVAVAPTTASAHGTASCQLPRFGPGKDYHPTIDPKRFSPEVDNPFFPQVVGRTLVYTGVKDGKKALDIVQPTSRTRTIDGVKTRVVEDRLYLDNVVEERTSDYYAQDRCGNVWYFGEDTAELDTHGKVISTEGSFHAGIGGAEPGVFMQAHPQVGRKFRQEWFEGQAEDVFWVLEKSASVSVPFGSFRHALRTAENTRLEPDVLDNKYYVKGTGEVAELSVKGPPESLRFVEVIS